MAVRRNKMKKIWKKPNLVVLIRSRPEESVLDHCKYGFSEQGGGANSNVNGCHAIKESGGCIGVCMGQETT
jgi:hypothetical protein